MKKIVILALACVASVNLMAQGRVSFGNLNAGAGIDAQVFDTGTISVSPDGSTQGSVAGTALATGGTYKAQLYVGTAPTDLVGTGLVSVTNNPVNFASPGYLASATRTLGLPGGTVVNVQMRAWRASDGATFEAAQAAGGIIGWSKVVQVSLTLSPTAAAPMVGLTSFDVGVVPEPSTIALGAFGLLAAWMIRRRK